MSSSAAAGVALIQRSIKSLAWKYNYLSFHKTETQTIESLPIQVFDISDGLAFLPRYISPFFSCDPRCMKEMNIENRLCCDDG